MYIYISLVVLPVVTNFIMCDSTSDLPKDAQQKETVKISLKESSSTSNPISLNPIVWQPLPRVNEEDYRSPRISLSSSHLTKLAKTLSLGFQPTFSKDYFEPFERRPRPVTLVTFRKNGFAARHVINFKYNDVNVKSLEVAELQSPYNDVGHFWQEEQGEP